MITKARSPHLYRLIFVLATLTLSWLAVPASVSPALDRATTLFAWANLAPSPLARFEAQSAVVAGKLYVLGGFYTNQIQATIRADAYDPATNQWTQIADLPMPITHGATAVDGAFIYLIGGYVGDSPGPSTTSSWRYDLRTNAWSTLPALPASRGGGGAAIVGRRLYFFGGATREAGTTTAFDQSELYILDLDNPTAWTSGASLPGPRNHIGSVALNGKVYAIGGQQGDAEATTNQRRVDVYDPALDRWSAAAALPQGVSHTGSSTIAIDANRIFVIGGTVNGGSSGLASQEVYAYDARVDTWVQLPSLPGGRKTPAAGAIRQQLIVATGNDGGPTNTTWAGTLPDHWEIGPLAPIALGEVAGGIVTSTLYLVGEGSTATLAFDLGKQRWGDSSKLAKRPLPGNHHAAEIYKNKLYLFGGLGNAAEGKVQIYNPATNTWMLGADMPFAAGSSASALIGDKIYLAGGIVGTSTTTQAAVYDPLDNSWVPIAPMPQGRNHTAAATDGSKLYIFGGRGPGSGDGNQVANGFDTVQIYHPATDSWQSSATPGATLVPLPQARGGMGRAVYAGGEFYIIGGETLDGVGATTEGVYNRVDVYNPLTNSWRLASDMPTARHGIFPLAVADRIYIAGGGVKAAGSKSALLEIYNVPWEVAVEQVPILPTPTCTPTPVGTALQASPVATLPATPRATETCTPTAPTIPDQEKLYVPLITQGGGG